jgi:hypothetical protein
MKNHNRIDRELSALVRSVKRHVPAAVEERLRIAAQSAQPLPRKQLFRRPLLVLTSMVGMAALLLAIIIIIPSLRREEIQQIVEIRTQFVVADKGITIVFVQKPDFPVLVTSF